MNEQSLLGFSSPEIDFDENLLNSLLTKRIYMSFSSFIQHPVFAKHPLIKSLIGVWIRQYLTVQSCNDPCVFALPHNMPNYYFNNNGNPDVQMAKLCLWLTANNVPGDWQITLPSSYALFFGNYLLPPSHSFAVQCVGNKRYLTLSTLKHSKLKINIDNQEELDQYEYPHIIKSNDRSIVALNNDCKANISLKEFMLEDDQSIVCHSDLIKNIENSLDLMSKNSPVYFKWVTRLLKKLMVIPSTIDVAITSGSCGDGNRGSVYISESINPVLLAELMVHECSHLYYYILSPFLLFHNTSDKTLYYSPFKKTKRPLQNIILTYHATANFVHLYNFLVQKGDTFYETNKKRQAMLHEKAASLKKQLIDNPNVTELGQFFLAPLYKLI